MKTFFDYRRQLLALVASIVVLAAPAARADNIAYQEVVDLSVSSARLLVQHHHDWDRDTREARYKMMTTDKDPFGAGNTFSTLRVVDKASGTELFRRPVPALTHLWINPASTMIVGLSNVQLDNPYHLVVFSNTGERLFETSLLGMNWPGTFESVTNWISWYKRPEPRIELVEGPASAVLSVEDQAGTMRTFMFPLKRSSEALNSGTLVNP